MRYCGAAAGEKLSPSTKSSLWCSIWLAIVIALIITEVILIPKHLLCTTALQGSDATFQQLWAGQPRGMRSDTLRSDLRSGEVRILC